MQAPKLVKDAYSLLKYLFISKHFVPGKVSLSEINDKFCQSVHAHMIKSAQIGSATKTNTLLNLYVKCGEIFLATQLFNEVPERNLVTWSTLMAGYLHNGLSAEVIAMFASMNNGFSPFPNEYVLSTVISSCTDLLAIQEGKQCHAYIVKSGYMHHSYVANALIHMYSRSSDVGAAFTIFKAIRSRDSFAYNSLITWFLEQGYITEALEVLSKMHTDFVEWDVVTYSTALGLCACLKILRLGRQIHGQILTRRVEVDVYIGSAIIDMYGKCGQVASARTVFNRQACHNVVTWTTLMTIYAQNGCFEEALNLYMQMESARIRPSELTFVIMLNSCASLSALRHGDMLNAHIQKMGFMAYLVVGNALIYMYTRCGNIEDAHKIFVFMPCRNDVSWNSIISGYSHHGLGCRALELFHQMLATGERPNYVTFVGVLSACARLGLVDDGFYFLNNLMKNMGITPGLEHYTCIVGLLCRSGQLAVAENFMRSTPIEWDVVAWRTLLSACLVHQNISMGKRVAKLIFQLDPGDVGTHILLSNIYAKVRRWDGVANIRSLMRCKEIKKEPGVSWIQVGITTHLFISEDRSHPQSTNIYKKLTELISEIKLIGYVPEFGGAFHDVEDEQKEENLRFHSEKLAIAFGLINLPADAPVLIFKNLRICEDCHTASKLISSVSGRKIVIGDANRFHHFEAGSCSCGDYW